MKSMHLYLLAYGIGVPVLATAATGGGPYDRYSGAVREVLDRIDGTATADQVADLMRQARRFRYRMRHPYRAAPPEETETLKEGDCKDKSLWLAWRMNDGSIRYVFGRARPTSDGLHAWLLWKHDAHWWVLDCTNHDHPIRTDHLAPGEYVAIYQWTK
jgi:hypothetical protein